MTLSSCDLPIVAGISAFLREPVRFFRRTISDTNKLAESFVSDTLSNTFRAVVIQFPFSFRYNIDVEGGGVYV